MLNDEEKEGDAKRLAGRRLRVVTVEVSLVSNELRTYNNDNDKNNSKLIYFIFI